MHIAQVLLAVHYIIGITVEWLELLVGIGITLEWGELLVGIGITLECLEPLIVIDLANTPFTRQSECVPELERCSRYTTLAYQAMSATLPACSPCTNILPDPGRHVFCAEHTQLLIREETAMCLADTACCLYDTSYFTDTSNVTDISDFADISMLVTLRHQLFHRCRASNATATSNLTNPIQAILKILSLSKKQIVWPRVIYFVFKFII